MSLVHIDWFPGPRPLRRFGITVIPSLLLAAALLELVFASSVAALVACALAAVLGVPALFGTRIAYPGYWMWMGLAFVLGNTVGRVTVALVYFLVVTPTGLCRRALGGDRLRLRPRRDQSYWIDLERDQPPRHERQF